MTTPLTHPRIILDTDPGGDDIYAFLWLLSLVKSGLAELVAVTSADGNVAAKRTFSSASQIFNLAGFPQIKVGRGIPIKQVVEDAGHIHGSDGMGNVSHTLYQIRPSESCIHLSVLFLCVLERTLRFNHSNATGIDITESVRDMGALIPGF